MARAAAHLSAGRFAEAEGAYNAILSIDATEYRAHLGLADCSCGRGRTDDAVSRLSEQAQSYAASGSMRAAFALITKALAIAPERLDLHIDVAELEAADGRAHMAAKRLENLARTYQASGQAEEAALVLEAAEAFRAPPMPSPPQPPAAPFINPHTGHATPPPAPRAAATPPPPPPASQAPTPIPFQPTPTPIHPMVRPSPLAAKAPPPPPKAARAPAAPPAPKAKAKARRGSAKSGAPRWRPSTVTQDPPPRPKAKPKAKAKAKAKVPAAKKPVSKPRLSIAPAPRPRKTAKPIATVPKKRASIAPAPSPSRGGKTLDKLPPLRQKGSLASRLRAASAARPVGDEDRTSMWRPAT